jgi:hypothetical protein
MTKDPICGMTVDEATSLRTECDGQTDCDLRGGHCQQVRWKPCPSVARAAA